MTDGVNLPIVLTVRLCQTVKVWNQTWIKLTWFFALCHPFLTFFWSDRVRWQTRLDKMKTHVPDSSTSGLQNKTTKKLSHKQAPPIHREHFQGYDINLCIFLHFDRTSNRLINDVSASTSMKTGLKFRQKKKKKVSEE